MDIDMQFFGRFHPLLVHLPIGILYLAFIFEFLSYFPKYKKLRQGVQPALFWGALFAVLSAGSGLLLSQEGGHEEDLLTIHQNTGIATAVVAIVLLLIRRSAVNHFQDKGKRKLIRIFLFIPLICLLSLTGHLGGSLTHGEDYLFDAVLGSTEQARPSFKFASIEEADSAILYRDVIEPILSSRCYDCHSSRKQKGQLRLDEIRFIEKGGKNGEVIVAGIPDSSLLYSRLMLPLEDEHHMPPNEKRQLSSAEIALMKSWIEEGAPFDKVLHDFKGASKITGYLNSILSQSSGIAVIPQESVAAADSKAVDALTGIGVLVVPVGSETNYLSASFTNVRQATDKELALLLPLKDQLLWLNLGRTKITDEGLKTIAQLNRLTNLNLEYTTVGDTGLAQLLSLSKLTSLNLVGTQSGDSGLKLLFQLPELKKIFVYQTNVTAGGISSAQSGSRGLAVDSGNYRMPVLTTDTLIFKGKR